MSKVDDSFLYTKPKQYVPTQEGTSNTQRMLNDQHQAEAKAKADAKATWTDGLGAAAGAGTIGFVDRLAHSLTFAPSDAWTGEAAEAESEKWHKLGISDEQLPLLHKSVSQAHADYLYGIARQNMQHDEDMSHFSTLSQMALSAADPGFIALDAIAAPLGFSASAGRLVNAGRAALVAGGENAAMVGAEATYNPQVTTSDAVQAGLTGIALGGFFGLKMGEKVALTKSASRYATAVKDLDDARKAGDGNDSMGAARVKGSTVDTMDVPTRDPSEIEQHVTDEALKEAGITTAMLKVRKDISSIFAKSSVPEIKWLGRKLVKESVGYTDKEIAVATAAESLAQKTTATVSQRWRPAADKAWHRYRLKHNIGIMDAGARHHFNTQLGRYMRGDLLEVDPEIAALVPHVNDANRRVMEELKAAGVPGFENVEHTDGYLQRLFSRKGFEDVFQNKHLNFDDVREQVVRPAMERAWRLNGHEFSDETLDAVSKAWLDQARKKASGNDSNIQFRGLNTTDAGSVRKLLEDQGLPTEKIDALVKGLEDNNSAKAVHNRAKHRIDMDESYSADVTSRDTGETHKVAIADFLENDVDRMLTHHVRELAGWAALARTTGIGNKLELQRVRDMVATKSAAAGEDSARILRAFDISTASILGHSTERHADEAASRWSRVIRDYAHLLSMGAAGVMVMVDAGNITSYSGFRTAMRALPEMRNMFKRMQDGTFSHADAQWLGDNVAAGTDWTLNPMWLRNDDIGASAWSNRTRTGRVLNRVDNLQQGLKRVQSVASGMAPIQAVLQRWAALSSMGRILELANKEGEISAAWRHRLRNWGLSKQDQEALFARLKGKKNVGDVEKDWGNWSAHEREAMSAYMWRVTRHQVLGNDVGDSMIMMHSAGGKIFMQLKHFTTESWTNHLLNGVHLRDHQAFMMFTVTSVLGAAVYSARTYVQTIGNPKGRKERLSMHNILTQGIAQNSWSSILPMLTDTLWSDIGNQDPVFRWSRSSGLKMGISGIPALAAGNRVWGVGHSIGKALFTKEHLTQKDALNAWGALPLNNVLGLQNAGQAAARQFPVDSDR